MFDIKNTRIDRRKKIGEKAEKSITIRVTKSMSDFMREKEISPTALVLEALRICGYKKPKEEEKDVKKTNKV